MLIVTPRAGPVWVASLVLVLAGDVAMGEAQTVGGRTYEREGGAWWLIDGADRWEVIPSQIVVELEPDVAGAAGDSVISGLGLDVLYRADWGSYCHVAVPRDADPVEVLSLCLKSSGVADAWADTRVRWAAVPTDPFYAFRTATGDTHNLRPWWHQTSAATSIMACG